MPKYSISIPALKSLIVEGEIEADDEDDALELFMKKRLPEGYESWEEEEAIVEELDDESEE
jgi:hypothetical protein